VSDGVFNLNKARKAKARAEEAAQAAQNRVVCGLSKARKQAARDAADKAARALESHRREP